MKSNTEISTKVESMTETMTCQDCGYTYHLDQWKAKDIEVQCVTCSGYHMGVVCPNCGWTFNTTTEKGAILVSEEEEALTIKSKTKGGTDEFTTAAMEDLASTQKAKGVMVLQSSGHRIPSTVVARSEIQLVYNVAAKLRLAKRTFLRGCPKRPRHGFIDSKVVSTVDEAKALWNEVIAAEPDGEMLVCDYIDAAYNVVWTPNGLTIGQGNSGATGGKGAVLFPLTSKIPASWLELSKRAGIDIPREHPFIEAVIDKNENTWLTQLRAGPPAPQVENYIPRKVCVKKVIDARRFGSMEWELLVPSLEEGEVIWHEGGGLNCHHGIHAFIHKKPYVTTFEPKVGDILGKSTIEESYDINSFINGLAAGTVITMEANHMLRVMAIGLHNAVSLTGRFSFWLGASVALMLKLGTAAAYGEYRHSDRASLMASKGLIKVQKGGAYSTVFEDYFYARSKVAAVCIDFWNCPWGTGYGGPKWGDCIEHTILLDQFVCELLRQPSQEAISKIIAQFNVVVEKAHNGGWWLNKFGSQSTFNAIAAADPLECLHIAPDLYKLHNFAPSRIVEAKEKWSNAGFIGRKMKLLKTLTEAEKRVIELEKDNKSKEVKSDKKEGPHEHTPFLAIESVGAQCKVSSNGAALHVQLEYPQHTYASVDLDLAQTASAIGGSVGGLKLAIAKMPKVKSLNGSGVDYWKLNLSIVPQAEGLIKYIYKAYGLVIFNYVATEAEAFKQYEQKM